MTLKLNAFLFVTILFLSSCGSSDDIMTDNEISNSEIYFPPIDQPHWETVTLESLSWNSDELSPLYEFLSENNTRAFMVLKNGKIVIEEYWGENRLGTAEFDANSKWYWASAGKTLTASLLGIAQKDGLLSIEDKTSTYLGSGWTSLSIEKENLISLKHHLQMTSGLDYEVSNLDCTLAECLQYKADAGLQWYYHNAPYTLLSEVISVASNMDYNLFTDLKIEEITGMDGMWLKIGDNKVYWSTARDMARFALLTLNNGSWDNKPPVYSMDYYSKMTNTSQDINLSYGYLWWLNGKDSIIYPGFTSPLGIDLAPDAPDDMISALGKNSQFINIIPSQNLIVIRIGEAPENSLVPIQFHNEMWQLLDKILMD